MEYKSHSCCFEQGETPACGIKGLHRCCLCEKPMEQTKQENWERRFDKKAKTEWMSRWDKYDETDLTHEKPIYLVDAPQCTSNEIKDFIRTEIEAAEKRGWKNGNTEISKPDYDAIFSAGRASGIEEGRMLVLQEIKKESNTKKTRKCTLCKEEFPLNKDYFYPTYYKKSLAFSYRCKKCEKVYRGNRKEYTRNYQKQVRMKNPHYRVHQSFASSIYRALKDKKAGRKWEDLVGYSMNDLMQHLQKQFDSNMNWDNYGSYWHIDHIKPKSLFNFENVEDEEFKKCWSLKNLQPLEKSANLRKWNHY